MSRADLDRVRADLAAMREAAGFDLPFGRTDVRLSLGVAAAGAAVAGWAAFVPWGQRWGTLAPLLLLVAAYGVTGRRLARDRGREPARWRELRLTLIAAAVIGPVAVGYLFWEKSLGVPRNVTGAAAVVFFGAAALVVGLADRARRHYLASAGYVMALGLAIPLLRPGQVPIAAGLCLIAAGLSTAAVQAWQLRHHGTAGPGGRAGGEVARAAD